MKKLMKPRIAFFAIATLIPLSGCANHSATFKVRVVNEEGQPINGVHADIYNVFDMDSKPGLTDINGLYSSHLNNIVEVSGRFEKHGYYKTRGVFWQVSEREIVPPADTNFVITMRRIIDPVPMIHKRFLETHLPLNDEPVGFDLEAGDWVSPHGKGKTADFQMTGTIRYESQVNREAKINMDFIGELCGIQSFMRPQMNASGKVRSELKPPHTAPDDGYESQISLWWRVENARYAKTHEITDRNYLFRTRVVSDL